MFNLEVKSWIEKSNANGRDLIWVKITKFAENQRVWQPAQATLG
jgi:hypothetical protein